MSNSREISLISFVSEEKCKIIMKTTFNSYKEIRPSFTKISCFHVGELLQSREIDTNQHSPEVRRRIRSSSSRAEIALAFRVLAHITYHYSICADYPGYTNISKVYN